MSCDVRIAPRNRAIQPSIVFQACRCRPHPAGHRRANARSARITAHPRRPRPPAQHGHRLLDEPSPIVFMVRAVQRDRGDRVRHLVQDDLGHEATPLQNRCQQVAGRVVVLGQLPPVAALENAATPLAIADGESTRQLTLPQQLVWSTSSTARRPTSFVIAAGTGATFVAMSRAISSPPATPPQRQRLHRQPQLDRLRRERPVSHRSTAYPIVRGRSTTGPRRA